jgi:uncharacterized protein
MLFLKFFTLFVFFLTQAQAAFMKQTWSNLFFVHFEVAKEELEKLVPAPLEIETFDDRAYLGIVGLEMNAAKTNLGKIPLIFKPFAQVNIRTYVKYKNYRGVYFLSIDAPHLLTIMGAKTLFSLPYEKAQTSMNFDQGEMIIKSSNEERSIELRGFINKNLFYAEVGSLEEFLTKRDSSLHLKFNCLYYTALVKKDWALQDVMGSVTHQLGYGKMLSEPISFLYSVGTEVLFDTPKKVACF